MVEKLSLVETAAGSSTVRPSAQPTEPPKKVADYYKWSNEQAGHIRAGRFDQIDLLNVADEIEDVGKSEKRELTSNLENILVHILKWTHQPQRRGRSWSLSIAEHRRRVIRNIRDNQSLASQFSSLVVDAYDVARLRAAREMGLAQNVVPEACPYGHEQIMDVPYEIDEGLI